MGRKKTQPDDKYLKRRRYYLKSKVILMKRLTIY